MEEEVLACPPGGRNIITLFLFSFPFRSFFSLFSYHGLGAGIKKNVCYPNAIVVSYAESWGGSWGHEIPLDRRGGYG